MEYTLFQDFARKIPRPAPPTDRPGPAQSGRTPVFGYGPKEKHIMSKTQRFYVIFKSSLYVILWYAVMNRLTAEK